MPTALSFAALLLSYGQSGRRVGDRCYDLHGMVAYVNTELWYRVTDSD